MMLRIFYNGRFHSTKEFMEANYTSGGTKAFSAKSWNISYVSVPTPFWDNDSKLKESCGRVTPSTSQVWIFSGTKAPLNHSTPLYSRAIGRRKRYLRNISTSNRKKSTLSGKQSGLRISRTLNTSNRSQTGLSMLRRGTGELQISRRYGLRYLSRSRMQKFMCSAKQVYTVKLTQGTIADGLR